MIQKASRSVVKAKYKITNWKEYNQALENRGNITLWFSEDCAQAWYANNIKTKVGAPFLYSDHAIEVGLMIKAVFHLGLRQLVGFLKSVILLKELNLKVPTFSVFSKRSAALIIKKINKLQERGEPIHAVIDSTGLEIYGEGEWKVKKHGESKKKTWRKLHLAVDDNSRIIFSSELTTIEDGDSSQVEKLTNKNKEDIFSVTADGAYDTHTIYNYVETFPNLNHIAIPPRGNSSIDRIKEEKMTGRDHQVLMYEALGPDEWVDASAYKRQNIAENAMYRYKQIIGDKMNARTFAIQIIESEIGVNVLNKMTMMGMPQSYRV